MLSIYIELPFVLKHLCCLFLSGCLRHVLLYFTDGKLVQFYTLRILHECSCFTECYKQFKEKIKCKALPCIL